MTTYTCVFRLYALGDVLVGSVKSENGIAEFERGFWLDSSLKLSKSSEATYWIPPSQILYIEVERNP